MAYQYNMCMCDFPVCGCRTLLSGSDDGLVVSMVLSVCCVLLNMCAPGLTFSVKDMLSYKGYRGLRTHTF